MAVSQSSNLSGSRKASFKKPYPTFPLTPRGDNRWCKKIRGRFIYFKGTWEEALAEYNRVCADVHAGRTPFPKTDELTVADLCNRFLEVKEALVNSGELKKRTWEEYRSTCQRLIGGTGRTRPAMSLNPGDFSELRSQMAEKLGPMGLGNEINRTRMIFKFGVDEGLIDRVPVYGQGFKRPSRKVLRVHRAAGGLRMFESSEVLRLLETSRPQLRAMILLAVNCGLGNTDCGKLTTERIDFEGGWLNYPRPKTGVARKAKLWPETMGSLRIVLGYRTEGLAFRTKRGNSWHKEGPDCPIAKEFRKLLDSTGLYRPWRTFYALRHTFETIAGGCLDQVCVNAVMGHVDASMAATYRERIEDSRYERVAEHVRNWLLKQVSK